MNNLVDLLVKMKFLGILTRIEMARFVVRRGSSQIGDCSLSQFHLVTVSELLFSNNLAQLREYQVHRYLGIQGSIPPCLYLSSI